jgi:hypothetical protein
MLAGFFDGDGSASFGVADAFLDCREGLIAFILDHLGRAAEVEFFPLRHNHRIALAPGVRNASVSKPGRID